MLVSSRRRFESYFEFRNGLPKNEHYSPHVLPDVDELFHQIWRILASCHLLTKGCSAVNGCRQNERLNS